MTAAPKIIATFRKIGAAAATANRCRALSTAWQNADRETSITYGKIQRFRTTVSSNLPGIVR